jgi:hypothetical protein
LAPHGFCVPRVGRPACGRDLVLDGNHSDIVISATQAVTVKFVARLSHPRGSSGAPGGRRDHEASAAATKVGERKARPERQREKFCRGALAYRFSIKP